MKIEKSTALWLAACAILLTVISVTRVSAHTAAQQSRKPQNPGAGEAQTGMQDGSMPGMDMGDMQKDAKQNPQAAESATDAMSSHEMDMGAHMFMTDLQPENRGDKERAEEITVKLRASIAKYKDYHVALADNFRIFLPNLPQEQYHFTNYANAFTAQFKFDPEHPTSLLYKKTADGYELAGAMYTAPKRASLQELNERVPLSVARWHKHVNICLPPKDTPPQQVDWKKFGAGSIATEDACSAANGRWLPQIFGWMVHVYPFEADPNKVWAH